MPPPSTVMDITFHRNSLIHLLSQVNPFWIQFFYFLSSSITGFLLLKLLPTRDATSRPTNVDLLFMSVSANTVSSMDTMEMEVFSNYQLAVLTLLMVIGGEVFISMLSVHFTKINSQMRDSALDAAGTELATLSDQRRSSDLKFSSRKHLFFVVLGYLLVGHVVGFLLILVYLRLVPEAGAVLERKVQVLVGNTLYASCLWAVIWLLKKLTKRREYDYLLTNYGEMECNHLLPGSHSLYLALTVAGLVLVQFGLFCCMEWTSEILSGLSTYQKVVGVVFQCVNSRYAGETIVDLAAVAPAILVLFVVMMYIPPYTCFLPRKGDKQLLKGRERSRKKQGLSLIFSPLSYIAIFTIIACITERRQISEDPINFSVLNIVVEVVSSNSTPRLDRRVSAENIGPKAAMAFLIKLYGCIWNGWVHNGVQLQAASEGGRTLQRRVGWVLSEMEQQRETCAHRCHVIRQVEKVQHERWQTLEIYISLIHAWKD
ncbi:cation transporter HKT1;5 isoform X3 [Musa acuminata AAA Group]|uniref:cation transporter HKT1;5 isoform X3 n=1 Tax=Musa acuminata AAA Group TaxID=214697 RepID=UPI0008A0C152|nr:PREDICTED: cation transporter HKT8-like isoform X3 [Musa acuminata subsp. malaccensis]